MQEIQKYNFLFIDDCETTNTYIQLLIEIESLPIIANFKMNGLQALEYLQGLSANEFPDVILVDLNMPLMDGFEFVDHYKRQFYPQHSSTLLYAMSSTRILSEIEKIKTEEIVEDFLEKALPLELFQTSIFPLLETKRKNKLPVK